MTEEALLACDKKQNVMFCAQVMDVYPTIPRYLRGPRSSQSGGKKGPFSSTYDSRGGSSTAGSSMYTSSPNNGREVDSSSAPPPVPSPPKSRWGFGFNTARPAAAEAGEGTVYYDSDGEVESAPGCGLGGFGLGIFSCITRN